MGPLLQPGSMFFSSLIDGCAFFAEKDKTGVAPVISHYLNFIQNSNIIILYKIVLLIKQKEFKDAYRERDD